MTLNFRIANAANPPEPAIIAHLCNDVGAWGAGFTAVLSKRWPEVEYDYRRFRGELGTTVFSGLGGKISVAHMVTQRGVGTGVRRVVDWALTNCLRDVREAALRYARPVYMPRIGCGLAGAKWEEIEPIVRVCLADHCRWSFATWSDDDP